MSADWLLDDSADWPPPATDQQSATELVLRALRREGLAGELTGDERQVLAGFRRLGDRQQGRVLGIIEGLADAADGSDADVDPLPPHEREAITAVRAIVAREIARQTAPAQRKGAG